MQITKKKKKLAKLISTENLSMSLVTNSRKSLDMSKNIEKQPHRILTQNFSTAPCCWLLLLLLIDKQIFKAKIKKNSYIFFLKQVTTLMKFNISLHSKHRFTLTTTHTPSSSTSNTTDNG